MVKPLHFVIFVVVTLALSIAIALLIRKPSKTEVINRETYKNPIVTSQYLGEVGFASVSKFEPIPGKICFLAQANGVSIWCEPDKQK